MDRSMKSVVLALALTLGSALVPGCLEEYTREDTTIPPATGPCAALGEDSVQALVLVQVRRIALDDDRDDGPVAGVLVDMAKGAGSQPFDNATTNGDGCVAFRMRGGGLYEASASDGTGVCQARGLVRGATDAENHLELTLKLQDPCA